jgi:glycosyltransferase involved in cell wall biosynthesis
MAEQAEIQKWIDRYDLEQAVELLPNQSRNKMAEIFRQAAVAVSPSSHDGTPNTLLEAMACGCYPVASDLESIREWITPGENGSLFDPSDPHALANAVNNALTKPDLRQEAAKINYEIIMERAEYQTSMARAAEFYKTVLGN